MKRFLSLSILFAAAVCFTVATNAQTSLKSLSGGNVDVQAQRGKVVILAVGASWLPLSAKQAAFTNTLAKKYAGKNVVVFFVATDSADPKSKNYATDDQLRQWGSKNSLAVPILRDPDAASVLSKFSIDQLPSFVILDKSGKQAGDAFGGIDPKFDLTVPISKRVDSLL